MAKRLVLRLVESRKFFVGWTLAWSAWCGLWIVRMVTKGDHVALAIFSADELVITTVFVAMVAVWRRVDARRARFDAMTAELRAVFDHMQSGRVDTQIVDYTADGRPVKIPAMLIEEWNAIPPEVREHMIAELNRVTGGDDSVDEILIGDWRPPRG